MGGQEADLLKKEKEKNEITEFISATIYHPVLEKIYEKNLVVTFLGEMCAFIDEPKLEDGERIRVTAGLIYWDIVFYLIENRFDVFADNQEILKEKLLSDHYQKTELQRNVLLLNSAAAYFYSILNMRYVYEHEKNESMLTVLAM